MSKGGAGKVYFVLYLAVILELLIIIVERDEAEEHLVTKQKESMKIVQSILSQLQTGSGSEGISTRPQDEITLKPAGYVKAPGDPDIKEDRTYLIEVGVTDVSTMPAFDKMKARNPEQDEIEDTRTRTKLANVQELEYQVFYHPSKDPNNAPQFLSDAELSKVSIADKNPGDKVGESSPDGAWTLEAVRRIEIDVEKTQDFRAPKYKPYSIKKGPAFNPRTPAVSEDSVFVYSQGETERIAKTSATGAIKKRAFVVKFQPPQKAGWYKLRFSSQTNKILGVRRTDGTSEIDPETKINIGTVQLTVKELDKVEKELSTELESYGVPKRSDVRTLSAGEFNSKIDQAKQKAAQIGGEKGANDISRINLYGYILRLLTPGGSENFDQNRGSIEFNLRVVEPPKRPDVDGVIADLPKKIHVFDKIQSIEIPFSVAPANGQTKITKNPGNAQVRDGGSVSATATGKINKSVVLPIAAAGLVARPEPYILELVQNNGRKDGEAQQCEVYVYSTQIVNTEEIKNAIGGGWGDQIEFSATPGSSTNITANEFKIEILGQTISGLKVSANNNVFVPKGANKVSAKILWYPPANLVGQQPPVEIATIEEEVSIKQPRIIITKTSTDAIRDNDNPEFIVRGIEVLAPEIGGGANANISSVVATVENPNIRDRDDRSIQYKVQVLGTRRASGNTYEVRCKLTGGRTPLNPGKVKGTATLRISATATADGATSRPKQQSTMINITN